MIMATLSYMLLSFTLYNLVSSQSESVNTDYLLHTHTNIMASTLLGDHKLCRVSHVNTLCEILNGLQGLMHLNGYSGPPTAS